MHTLSALLQATSPSAGEADLSLLATALRDPRLSIAPLVLQYCQRMGRRIASRAETHISPLL